PLRRSSGGSGGHSEAGEEVTFAEAKSGRPLFASFICPTRSPHFWTWLGAVGYHLGKICARMPVQLACVSAARSRAPLGADACRSDPNNPSLPATDARARAVCETNASSSSVRVRPKRAGP